MIALSSKRVPAERILAKMKKLREHDARWQEGKTWSLVFHAGEQLANSLKVGLIQAAVKFLPTKLVSDLTARSSSMTGLKGAQLPKRSAAM